MNNESFSPMIRNTIASLILALTPIGVVAQTSVDNNDIDYSVSLTANAGTGTFAPYFISANRHGTLTQKSGVYARASAFKSMDYNRRFSWSAGVDIIGAMASRNDYERYAVDTDTWHTHRQGVSPVWVQQLYGEIRWRSIFLSVGQKEHGSALLNNSLASGDLIESGNARPIPEVRMGFIDFRDIPFTNGWVQLQGEFSFGKMTDNGWLKDHYNYYNHFLTLGSLYHYKRLYFRTCPSERFSVTLGMQAAGQFSGKLERYRDGEVWFTDDHGLRFRDFLDMLITRQDDAYYYGNHLGSWDMKARYRLRSGDEIYAYFQWPWEDGSGIGKLNGFDGTWGLEWKKQGRGIISGAVAELLYFMNHSGPLHWDPEDNVGSNVPGHTTGSDNYYNNTEYNGYANYGLCIGSPVFPGPIYNRDGYMAFVDNRLRGFHLGLSGSISAIDYRLLAGYREVFGTGYAPRLAPAHTTSAMIEATWNPASVSGLSVNAQVAMDDGNLYGNQFGVALSIRYSGSLSLKSRK